MYERDVAQEWVDPHTPGAKLDAGKPKVSLVVGGFSSAIKEVAKVATFGAEKYVCNCEDKT